MCELTQVMSREPWDSWRFNLPEQPSANELCRWVYESPSFPVPWRNYSSCIPESCLLILQWKWAPVAHCGDLIINIFFISFPSLCLNFSLIHVSWNLFSNKTLAFRPSLLWSKHWRTRLYVPRWIREHTFKEKYGYGGCTSNKLENYHKWPYNKEDILQHLRLHFMYQAETAYLLIFILSLFFYKKILIFLVQPPLQLV